MTTLITRDYIRQTLGPIVASVPADYYAEVCTYFTWEDGAPNCIVGQMLPGLGIGLDDLGCLNEETSSSDLLNSAAFEERGITVTPEAAMELLILQDLQDRNNPWSQVYAYTQTLSDEQLRDREFDAPEVGAAFRAWCDNLAASTT
jgi:hypothetical protein